MLRGGFEEQIDDAEQRQVYAYWRGKCVDGEPPPRTTIDPIELRGLLPIVGLIDVERQAGRRRFRYRLIGGYMVEMFGENFTGSYADESKHGEYGRYLDGLYGAAADGARPVYSESEFGYRGKDGSVDRSYLLVKRLVLPLLGESQVETLLFSNKFESMTTQPLSRPYRQADLVSVRELRRAHP